MGKKKLGSERGMARLQNGRALTKEGKKVNVWCTIGGGGMSLKMNRGAKGGMKRYARTKM